MSRSYENDDIKVTWNPSKCMHATHCWKQLGDVFQPTKRPWINLEGASSEAIRDQIDKCPSGALSYTWKGETKVTADASVQVQVLPNGPVLLSGNCEITHSDGRVEQVEKTALCRCGQSANKPFCDGAHNAAGFQG